MLIPILDANGAPHLATWQGQDQINDGSGSLQAGAVGPGAQPQQVLAANANRAGWLFQNTSSNAMVLIEIQSGSNPGPSASGWVVGSGQFFPPCGYPIPTGAIYVLGSRDSAAGDTFAARDWQNATGE